MIPWSFVLSNEAKRVGAAVGVFNVVTVLPKDFLELWQALADVPCKPSCCVIPIRRGSWRKVVDLEAADCRKVSQNTTSRLDQVCEMSAVMRVAQTTI